MLEQQPGLLTSLLTSSVRVRRSRYNIPSLALALLVTIGCISTLIAIMVVHHSPGPSYRHRGIAFVPLCAIVFTCWWLLWSFREPVVDDDCKEVLPTHERSHGCTWKHPWVTLPAALAGHRGRECDSAAPRFLVPWSRSGWGSRDATVVVALPRWTGGRKFAQEGWGYNVKDYNRVCEGKVGGQYWGFEQDYVDAR